MEYYIQFPVYSLVKRVEFLNPKLHCKVTVLTPTLNEENGLVLLFTDLEGAEEYLENYLQSSDPRIVNKAPACPVKMTTPEILQSFLRNVPNDINAKVVLDWKFGRAFRQWEMDSFLSDLDDGINSG